MLLCHHFISENFATNKATKKYKLLLTGTNVAIVFHKRVFLGEASTVKRWSFRPEIHVIPLSMMETPACHEDRHTPEMYMHRRTSYQ